MADYDTSLEEIQGLLFRSLRAESAAKARYMLLSAKLLGEDLEKDEPELYASLIRLSEKE